MQLCALRTASREEAHRRQLLRIRIPSRETRRNAFESAHVFAVPEDGVDAGQGAPVRAQLAVVRDDETGSEGVAGEAKITGENGLGAQEEDGFEKAAAAPVEDEDLARHFLGIEMCVFARMSRVLILFAG